MIAGVTNAEYHAHAAVGSTQLKSILRSPAHFWAAHRDPNRKPFEPSTAMLEGTVVHAMILEPDTVGDVVIAIPDDAPSKRSKAGESWWADFDKAAGSRIKVAADRLSELQACANNVRGDPIVSSLLADCDFEASGFWRDRDTGIECKFRPDAMKRNGSIIVDVKTTSDAAEDAFAKSIANYSYHLSASHYMEGALECTDSQPHSFLFLAVETFAPFAFAIYRADATVTSKGDYDRRRALKRLAECEAANDWPGYPSGIWPVSLPKWARRFEEEKGE
jgi:hypothetical protein